MRNFQRTLLCGASIVATMAAVSVGAFAQDTQTLETVTVTGVRESLRDSLLMKQNATMITENISTKDIGQLPDVTIAEELNRLPGLNTTLDRGNASQAAVRGLGPRLVLGLVNGREVASSEPDQNVRWEIYPSEIVGGASVYKSQDASLIAGGIAATIDIQTRSALDYNGPSLSLRAGPTYNDEANQLPHYSPWGGRGSASYITHITDNLAIALAGSFQREQNGYESFQGWGYNAANSGNAGDITGDGVPDATPWGAQSEVTEIVQDRTALAGTVDWRATPDLLIKVDGLFSAYTIHENQFQAWYGANTWGDWSSPTGTACDGATAWAYGCSNTSTTNPNVTTLNGVVAAASLPNSWSRVQNVIADYAERHNLIVAGINAMYTKGNWTAKFDVSHSEASRTNTWRSIYTRVQAQNMTFDTRAGQKPVVTTSGTIHNDAWSASFSDPADPAYQTEYTWDPGISAGPEYTRDRISAIAADVSRSFGGSFLSAIDAGVRWADRAKHHVMNQYYLCPNYGSWVQHAYNFWDNQSCTSGSNYTLPSGSLSTFAVKDFTVPDMVYGNYRSLESAIYPNTAVPAGADQLAQHWKVAETTIEGYLKAEIDTEAFGVPVKGGVGVHVVNVSTTSDGFSTTDGSNFSPVSIKHEYTEALPSLSLNFHVADDQVLRFGASIAMSRPPLDELRTGYSLSTSAPYTGSGGNPTLKPYKAKMVDLSYEWYFHEESLLAAALYYKHLDTFVGYASTNQVINGTSYTMYSPANSKGGDVTGLELTAQSRFFFLPGFLQDFGIYSNYAYVNSGVKELTPVANPLEATGFAKHTAEIDLWYSKGGIEARLAYKVHSPFTIIQGWNSQQLTRLDWERYLDASLSYQVNDQIGVRFQARNLTNASSRSYWDNNPQELARFDTFGRSFLFDISFKN